jgi:NADH-quinone oxidoreductase subunit N
MSAATAAFLPQALIAATLVALLLSDAFLPEGRKVVLARVAAGGVVAALVTALVVAPGPSREAAALFSGAIAVDSFSLFFQILLLGLTLGVLALAPAYLDRRGVHHGEFYVLLVAALAGMMILVAATSLVTIFLGIELLSIALYVLSGFLRLEERSQEAGLKYLLLGSFASGFLLYGMALLYGGTGSTSVARIAQTMAHLGGDNLLYSVIGVALLIVGLGFKASAAPFHVWTPDVYQGAPAPVVAFMSVGTKVAAIAVLLRVLVASLPGSVYPRWSLLLGAVAALSMMVGAVGALGQTELKRMLAYSSIAQAGYLLLAAVAGGQAGMVGGIFYLAAYGVMTFGAFGVVTLLTGAESESTTIESLRGLGYRQPALGALLAVFMLSLAGVPLTIGFMGKLFVFGAAVRSGLGALTLIAIISSAISLYYYLRVVVVLYTQAEEARPRPAPDPWGLFAVSFAAAMTVLLGVFPGLLYSLAQRASQL